MTTGVLPRCRLLAAVEPAVKRFNEKLKELNDTVARWDAAIEHRESSGNAGGVAEAEALQRAENDAERDTLLNLRDGMSKFVRLYEYIAQVVPLADPELEKLARFSAPATTKSRSCTAVI